jgi:hypothetical protein
MTMTETPAADAKTAKKKTDMVTIAMTASYPAPEDMTISDLTAEGQKALKLFA